MSTVGPIQYDPPYYYYPPPLPPPPPPPPSLLPSHACQVLLRSETSREPYSPLREKRRTFSLPLHGKGLPGAAVDISSDRSSTDHYPVDGLDHPRQIDHIVLICTIWLMLPGASRTFGAI